MKGSAPLLGVINAGSSSLKFAIYEQDTRVVSGLVDGIGLHPGVRVVGAAGQALAVPDVKSASLVTPADALLWLLPWLREHLGGQTLAAHGMPGDVGFFLQWKRPEER